MSTLCDFFKENFDVAYLKLLVELTNKTKMEHGARFCRDPKTNDFHLVVSISKEKQRVFIPACPKGEGDYGTFHVHPVSKDNLPTVMDVEDGIKLGEPTTCIANLEGNMACMELSEVSQEDVDKLRSVERTKHSLGEEMYKKRAVLKKYDFCEVQL